VSASFAVLDGVSFGVPGRSRTHDLLIRSQTLYPTELLAHDWYHQSIPNQLLYCNARKDCKVNLGYISYKASRENIISLLKRDDTSLLAEERGFEPRVQTFDRTTV
jgi:hypothetical protein